jgi:hypothetical protein
LYWLVNNSFFQAILYSYYLLFYPENKVEM